MTAMGIGGTMKSSVIENFSMVERKGSSSKRRMMYEPWPALSAEVCAYWMLKQARCLITESEGSPRARMQHETLGDKLTAVARES